MGNSFNELVDRSERQLQDVKATEDEESDIRGFWKKKRYALNGFHKQRDAVLTWTWWKMMIGGWRQQSCPTEDWNEREAEDGAKISVGENGTTIIRQEEWGRGRKGEVKVLDWSKDMKYRWRIIEMIWEDNDDEDGDKNDNKSDKLKNGH